MYALPPSHHPPSTMHDNYESDDDSDLISVDSRLTRASSATSYDVSMRSGSPAPSVYSITSSLRANSYRHEYGRGLNNYSEVYRLPADDEELDRLDKQHDMFRKIMGAYAPPMAEVMADDTPGEIKTVLDLGCGSGSWIMDAARDFPHCQAVAVDLVPMQAMQVHSHFEFCSKSSLDCRLCREMPENCRSEVDDINLGLQHFFGDFNVVHARLISSGIKDYQTLIDHISQVLRTRGLLELYEFDFRVYDKDHRPIFAPTGVLQPPWFALWMNFLNMAVRQRGGSPDAANMLHHWISRHAAFEEVVYREYFIPTAPFFSHKTPDYHNKRAIAETFRDDISAFLKSGRPLLLGSGLPESLVDELQHRAHQELKEARTETYIRVENVYARKRPFP
ncbi:hypothetical protein BV25DRAFT_1875105 [Artomyces pyxidatus]|uniref:Uncharacterized protein n=1 Tax=Artomyces pyxidatus TaxID=48021 RepID=A0ACB8THW3_9AGAM|nr:hypothetical protein BV25DRAFT_1875105 [Artomyces pyxidatus]